MTLSFAPQDVELIAFTLLGEPNRALSKPDDLRFGAHGSLRVCPSMGVYNSFEDPTDKGGVIDLIRREKGLSPRDAFEWMRSLGVTLPESDFRPAQRSYAEARGDADREPPPPPEPPPARAQIVQTYDYVDEAGTLLFQVCRMEPKTFRQRRPATANDDPKTTKPARKMDIEKAPLGWVSSTAGVRQVPYHLPELADDARGEFVFIAEGEKDVDNLRTLRLTATCNAGGVGGAGKTVKGLVPFFNGADVVILPDNDAPGGKLALLWANSLSGAANTIRILDLPGLPEKGDVSDWLAAGGTADELMTLARQTPLWDGTSAEQEPWDGATAFEEEQPAKPFVSRYGFLPWEDLDLPGPEHEYLIEDYLTAGDKSVVGGPSKSGKSFLSIHAAMSVARGVHFFGRPTQPGLVVYQAGEGARGIKKRLRAYRKHFGVPAGERVPLALLQSSIDLYRPDGDTAPLIAEIKAITALYDVPLRMVVIDTLATATGGADENSGKDMGTVMENISRINKETGAHVCLVHHLNAQGSKLRGHTSIYANIDQVILVTKNEETGIRTVKLDKQKDDVDGLTFQFELLSIPIGERPDGRPVTSCVVVDVGEKERVIKSSRSDAFKLRKNEVPVFRALLNALADYGEQPPSALRLPLGTRVVRIDHWKSEYEKISSIAASDNAIRQRLDSAHTSLMKFGVVGISKPFAWWWGKPVQDFPETYDRSLSPSMRSDHTGEGSHSGSDALASEDIPMDLHEGPIG